MGCNHQSWQHLAATLGARLTEMGPDGWRALHDAGVRGTYLTLLLAGRARLKLQFVKPVAQALDLDENRLFCTALEGMHQTEDLPYLNEFLWRMIETFEKVKPSKERKQKKKREKKSG